jgi:hypothetical protein
MLDQASASTPTLQSRICVVRTEALQSMLLSLRWFEQVLALMRVLRLGRAWRQRVLSIFASLGPCFLLDTFITPVDLIDISTCLSRRQQRRFVYNHFRHEAGDRKSRQYG